MSNQSAQPEDARSDEVSLRCVRCAGSLRRSATVLSCLGRCGQSYPVVDDVPILIDDETSVFSIADFVQGSVRSKTSRSKRPHWVQHFFTLSRNYGAPARFKIFADQVLSTSRAPRVLVVGAGEGGIGFDALRNPAIEIVNSDVALFPAVQYVMDAHSLGFADDTFDGVVLQAVLEHVADPWTCVREVERVLKLGGTVYAETPFMQQVHMGAHDFTRFTDLGHRRLFRRFEEIDRGLAVGPGTALAWSYQHFLASLARSNGQRKFAYYFARVTACWLKFCDRFASQQPAALDAASGLYFMGRKTGSELSDRDIIADYRGAQTG